MTNLETTYHNQTSVAEVRVSDWQNIIWREWRNCGDEEYAQHLFALVVDEPTGWRAVLIPALMAGILGALAGWLVALLFYPLAWFEGTRIMGIFWSPVIGGAIGFLFMIGVHLGRRSTWGIWLRGILPVALSFQTVFSLTSGMGVGVTGALFFDQTNSQSYYLLVPVILALFLRSYLKRQISVIVVIVSIVAGIVFGLFFGLGSAQLAGLMVGPFDLVDSMRVVGLATGVAVGLYLGRGVGLMGVLIFQVIVTILVMMVSINIVLIGWLVGMLVGGVIGSISQMWFPSDQKLDFATAYHYRMLCLWWAVRPYATQVEAALRSYPGEANWIEPLLHDLDVMRKNPPSVEALTGELRRNSAWRERFVAWHTFLTLGHEALPTLLSFKGWTSQRWRTAKWLVRSIGHETTLRLADKAEQLICPNCLTACDPRGVIHTSFPLTYYGCRICGQSREFLETPAGVVAVLDTSWQQERQHQNGLLRVNWLKHRELFDFDRVEIVQATDEDVERFAVQVGNDTDPLRTARYLQMQCVISPECHLSENTLRVLRRTFRKVD